MICPSCGSANPAGHRFCSECGTRLSDSQPAAAPVLSPAPAASRDERRVVTVLFSDLAGFTSRSEALDPEDARALLVPYYAILEAEITGHGGVVERHIGDGIMALFGAPIAHEDDPERAIRASLRILERLPALGTDLHARIGINTGEILYRSEGEGREDAVTGDAANTAARLQGLAPIDGVVVGESTWRTTSRAFEYTEHPAATAKGKAEPIRVFQPTAARARLGIDLSRTHDSPYVGREAELATIRAAFEAALSERRTGLVTVVAPAGMGKSRFIAEFGEHVEAQPSLVTWRQGRCLPYGDGITFWALGEIVKAHAGILETDDPASASRKILDALPESVDRDWVHQRLLPLVGVAAGSTAERAEAFAAWRAFLTDIAGRHPTVILVEDLHWADPALLAFLEDLATAGADVPLLIVATTRPELFERQPFATSVPGAIRIDLQPLTSDESSTLVAGLLGSIVPEDVRGPILERASGNPLFVEEFVRLVRDRDLLEDVDGVVRLRPGATLPVPDSIGALLAARLDMLEPDHRSLLGDAAVLGKVFWTGGVAALAERAVTDVEPAMVELARRELVLRAALSSMDGEDEYAFWHVLARDVAYAQLPRASRAALHVAAAKWLEARAGQRVDDIAELLAHHWSAALEYARAAGQTERVAALEPKALEFLMLAGERGAALDTAAALRNLERALALAPVGHEARPRLLLRYGRVASDAGRLRPAVDAIEAAIEAFRERGETREQAAAMIALRLPLTQLGDERSADLAREAVALLEPLAPDATLVQAMVAVATNAVVHEDHVIGIEYADRAERLAISLGLEVPVRIASTRGLARAGLGDPGGLDEMRSAIPMAIRAGDARHAATTYYNLALSCRWFGDVAGAASTIDEGVAFAASRGQVTAELDLRFLRAGLLRDAGALREAAVAYEALDDRLDPDDLGTRIWVRAALCDCLVWLGRASEADSMLTWLEAAGRRSDNTLLLVVSLDAAVHGWVATGKLDLAAAALREILSAQRTLVAGQDLDLTWTLVRAAIDVHDLGLAATFLEQANARAGTMDERGPLPLKLTSVAAAGAALAEVQGNSTAARDGYLRALVGFDGLGLRVDHALTLLALGRSHGALGERLEAIDVLQRVRGLFEQMEMTPALAETDALLAGLEVAALSPRRV